MATWSGSGAAWTQPAGRWSSGVVDLPDCEIWLLDIFRARTNVLLRKAGWPELLGPSDVPDGPYSEAWLESPNWPMGEGRRLTVHVRWMEPIIGEVQVIEGLTYIDGKAVWARPSHVAIVKASLHATADVELYRI